MSYRVEHRDPIARRWVDSGRLFESPDAATIFIKSLDIDGVADMRNNRIKAPADKNPE